MGRGSHLDIFQGPWAPDPGPTSLESPVGPAQLAWAGGDAADLPGSWRWRLLFDYYYLITHSSRFRGLESSFRVWGQSVNHLHAHTLRAWLWHGLGRPAPPQWSALSTG